VQTLHWAGVSPEPARNDRLPCHSERRVESPGHTVILSEGSNPRLRCHSERRVESPDGCFAGESFVTAFLRTTGLSGPHSAPGSVFAAKDRGRQNMYSMLSVLWEEPGAVPAREEHLSLSTGVFIVFVKFGSCGEDSTGFDRICGQNGG